MSGSLTVLQLQTHHDASGGGDVDVMDHERDLLESVGHRVLRYEVPSVEDSGLGSLRVASKVIWNRDAARDVARLVAGQRVDLAHVHSPYPLMSPSVVRACTRRAVPVVMTVHNYVFSCVAGTLLRDQRLCHDCVGSSLKLAGIRHRCYHDSVAASTALTTSLVLHRSIGTLTRDVDRYLTLTGFARDLMVRDGYAPEQITVKANSVPAPSNSSPGPDPSGRPYVLYAGRLLDIKGVRTLLAAWRRASDPALELDLVVAGSGPLGAEIDRLASEDPSVRPVGWVDEAELTRLMAGATATVVPSEWYEAGTPLVAIRSLSVGTPVLTSDLDSLATPASEDGAGRTFAVGSVEDLATALRSLARSPQDWWSMRDRALSSYQARYSPASNLRTLTQVYDEVVDAHLTTLSTQGNR